MLDKKHVETVLKYQENWSKPLVSIVTMLVIAFFTAGHTAAEPFSQFIVFGDGFSDHGNMFLATSRSVPASPPNFEGRLSDGPLWVERVAERFMLTLTPVQAGGTNYAYIGAKVNDDVSLPQAPGVTIPSLTSQVDMFLATIPPDDPENDIDNQADPNALYVVFGGMNDLFDLVTPACPVDDAELAANRVLIAIGKLGAEGAEYFLVPNLPPLVRTPRGIALDAESQACLALYTTAFNDLLARGLARLEIDLGIVVFRLDTAAVFDGIFANPAASGIVNVTDACLPGDALSGGTPCTAPGTHLFWDASRPTSAGHTAIANATLAGRVIMAETSIQAAVDMAEPNDIVIVPPGLYTGTVAVTQANLSILASRQAVLDASGQPVGLRVGAGGITPDAQGMPKCPLPALSNFTLRGLTIRNAQQQGVALMGVDTFELSGSEYAGNGQSQYGIHASCSQNGLIHSNSAAGHLQSAIYIDNLDNAMVRNNRLINNGLGIEVENSTNITIADNSPVSGNTAGIVISAQPGMPLPVARDIVIVDNTVTRNNRIPEQGRPGILGAVPIGTGILNLGGDNVSIGQNIVLRNDTLGIGVLSNPFVASDPRVEPAPDNNRVTDNLSLQNAAMPDPALMVPSADIVYDGSGAGNCFANNLTLTVSPGTLTSGFPCP